MYRPRRASFASVLIATSAIVLTSCQDDGRSGLPDDATAPATKRAQPTTTEEAPPAALRIPIGEVPTNPDAEAALRPWAEDLVADDIDVLTRNCWTIAPTNIATMYSDTDGILAAIAQPGVDGQFAVIWRGPDQTVSVKRSEIASGYACPRVYPTGSNGDFNDADAEHTVHRYLARWTGKPVDPSDVEDKYQLVCDGSAQFWDPEGTGSPTSPPLADNPGKLTGTTAFDDTETTSQALGSDYVEVSVPVTNSSGVTATRTFTLTIGANGYCIGDIAP